MSGLDTWIVGNPKSLGGETDFEMFSLIFEHAVQKEVSNQSAVGYGGLEVKRVLCKPQAYSLSI